MNLIQEGFKKVRFYTSMLDVEQWMEIQIENFDWHMSPTEGGWCNFNEPLWITGLEFKKKLKIYDYQFIWSVISAFPKGSKPFTSELPYADNNPDFWHKKPVKQLCNSLFEVVCWDSSATLFIGLSDTLAENLLKNAPDIKDLDIYNLS